eukprot:2833482-Rhodomonas_salina.2
MFDALTQWYTGRPRKFGNRAERHRVQECVHGHRCPAHLLAPFLLPLQRPGPWPLRSATLPDVGG